MRSLFFAAFYAALTTSLVFSQELGDVFSIIEAPNAQQFPDVAYNSTDNQFMVVWELVDPSDFDIVDIRGSIHDGDTGNLIAGPFTVLEDVDDLRAPEAAYNSVDNEYLVVARFESQNIAVAQRVDADGRLIGNTIDLGNSPGPTFFDPAARARVVSVAHNRTDNRYIVGMGGVSAQILFPNLDLDILIEGFGSGDGPAVAWSSQSNVYLMAWEDRSARPTGAENLSAQLFDASGELIGDLVMVRDQEFAEESPRVAYNSDDDQFLVVWDERIGFAEGNNTSTDTIGQIVDTSGTMTGAPIPIEQGTAYTLRQDVSYSSDAGMYLVVWKGDESGNFAFADIFGRFVNRDGSLAGDAFLIYDGGDDETDEGNSEQYYDESKLPVAEYNSQSGKFIVVWEEAGTNREPSDRDILARFIAPPGSSNVPAWMLY